MSNEFQDARIEELERDLAAAQTRAHDLANQVMVAWGERDKARAEAAERKREVESAVLQMNEAKTERANLEVDLAAAQAERAELRSCLSRAIEMSDEAWSDLTYRERAMLKPTIDQWRAALKE